ncbi:zinc-dependent alcohol dehydrogenase family protein [Nitrospinae bacterium AH_259_B05_G02_I21]|nr:zinc-dependent alcohol dehydrogenase family protein [Nitrospinae bacterium AH_259_B05_G02_I21]
MQAMVLREARPVEDHPLEAADLPVPEPGPGDVLLRVQVCGVCHTDLHTVEGDLALPKRPVVPGHQIVGRVERRGQGASRFAEGARVGVAWLHSACGSCDFCRRGLENLCEGARFTGYHVDGGYAEYAVVPEAFTYPIPDAFGDEEAAPLLCAGIIGYRALQLSNLESGQRLGLYGFGASAHLAIQVARHWGCEVYVFTRSSSHQQLALELGAAWVGQAQDEPPANLQSAIIFAPAGWLVPEALRVLDKGGTLALAGIHMSPIPELDYTAHLYHERTVRSVANSTRRDGEEFLELAAAIPVTTRTTRYPLGEANEALGALKAGSIDGAGVLEIP